jgi:hypothetical protein
MERLCSNKNVYRLWASAFPEIVFRGAFEMIDLEKAREEIKSLDERHKVIWNEAIEMAAMKVEEYDCVPLADNVRKLKK